MASEVDICNLALSLLGDEAAVESIAPPDGSVQAVHCARFYPIARDTLQGHPQAAWGFCLRRVPLALLEDGAPPWAYRYAAPAELLRALSVLPADARDSDASEAFALRQSGQPAVLTDLAGAAMLYVGRVTDTTAFSPPFVNALAHLLASYLAGPLLKGDTGRAVAKAMAATADYWLREAAMADSNQGAAPVEHLPSWIRGR